MNLVDRMLKAQEKLITLQNTRTIGKDDLILPQWIKLKAEYELAQGCSTEIRAVISIINSILYQNRIVFCLTLDSLSELVQNDNNFTKKFGQFDRRKYKAIIHMLTEVTGLLTVVKQGDRWSPTVYKLVDNDYRKFIAVDESQQMTEACEFTEKKQNLLPNALGKRTRKTHLEGRSKKKESINTVIKETVIKKEEEVINKQNETSLLVQSLQTEEELLTKAVGIQAEGDILTVTPPVALTPPKLTKQELADRLHCDFCFYTGKYADETTERILDIAASADVETGSALRDLAEVIMSNPNSELKYMSEHHLLALFRAVNTPPQLLP